MRIVMIICISVTVFPVHTRDISTFYFARIFSGEPRFEQPWLAEGFARLSGASSEHSYDIEGQRRNLLDVYGTHNPATWADEVSDLDPTTNDIDQLLVNLSNAAPPHITAHGDAHIIQLELQYTQNFDHGIFGSIHVPLRHCDISHVSFHPTYDSTHPDVTQLIHDLPRVFDRFGYDQISKADTQLGDISLRTGITRNYEETECIDFIDTTVQIGVLMPSGNTPDPRTVFDLPQGYYDRTGFMCDYTGAIGIFDWLTLGWHTHAIIFAPTIEHNRIHTHADAQGWITPRTATFHIEDGHFWSVGIYGNADHVIFGLSLLFGYSYDRQEPSHVTPRNADARPDVCASYDRRFRGWSKHTLHWSASYDFATIEAPYAPEITTFCNHVIDGNQVFESSLGGCSIGCNIAFTY